MPFRSCANTSLEADILDPNAVPPHATPIPLPAYPTFRLCLKLATVFDRVHCTSSLSGILADAQDASIVFGGMNPYARLVVLCQRTPVLFLKRRE